jgi:signal transduction histidine kinase
MKQKPNTRNKVIEAFEFRIFYYGLTVACFFRLIRSGHELMIGAPSSSIILGATNLVLLLVVMRFAKKYPQAAFVIFHVLVIVTSVVTWQNSGEWEGIIPYMIIVLAVFVIVTAHGTMQTITLLAYGALLIYFLPTFSTVQISANNPDYAQTSMEIDLFVTTLVLILLTNYIKTRFFRYRQSITDVNNKLTDLKRKLNYQTRTIERQKKDLLAARNRLEKIISIQFHERKNKTETIERYSFINAHHVRGPLARILGLIELMGLEQDQTSSGENIAQLKQEAQEIDAIVAKINETVSMA